MPAEAAENGDVRSRVVDEARSWIGTPYRLNAKVKGAGCDCATLILCVYRATGVFDDLTSDQHFSDWYHHARQERYLLWLMKHATKILEAVAYPSTRIEPGSIVAARVCGSKHYNHAGIVTKWPRIIHAVYPHVAEVDASKHSMWAFHQIAVFNPFQS